MLINARPRYVSHDFETFVPIQRAEPLHQRLVEMTDNDVNAWNFFRSEATPSTDWDENLDDLNNENFSVSSFTANLTSRLTIHSFILDILGTTRIQLSFLSHMPVTCQRRQPILLNSNENTTITIHTRTLIQCFKGKQQG